MHIFMKTINHIYYDLICFIFLNVKIFSRVFKPPSLITVLKIRLKKTTEGKSKNYIYILYKTAHLSGQKLKL